MTYQRTNTMKFSLLILHFVLIYSFALAQEIPAVYHNLHFDDQGQLFLKTKNGKTIPANPDKGRYTLSQMIGNPQGGEKGISFDFGDSTFTGIMYYGFIHYQDSRHPQPVYFKSSSKIKTGKAEINIRRMSGKYDMIGWQQTGYGTIGYRILDKQGKIIYIGRVNFTGKGPFEVCQTLLEGPFVNLLTEDGVTISFSTSQKEKCKVEVDGKFFHDKEETFLHEIKISGLQADKAYSYTVYFGKRSQSYSFKTAPKAGSRKAFIFAYASDSRSGRGGGERDVHGANFYMTKKIMALNSFKKVAFMQFTGDLINGYLNSGQEADLQYANWKRAIEPFAHYFPVVAGMGNHEAVVYSFNEAKRKWHSVDRFPFATHSAEAVFARNFVNPLNGPQSEDGAVYDPNPDQTDFPSYKENAFYYIYDNVAVIVMNSNYLYAPSLKYAPVLGGNLHAYIMDQQLAWVKKTLQELEGNPAIDHIFVTEHTPFFPNGGHSGDDMWYSGSNEPRPVIAGKAVEKGIIERRDQLLDLLINKSQKVRAILTGDEHNYCRTEIGPQTAIYPKKYGLDKIKLKRTIWQINNGSAGAPYYAQEKLPWSNRTQGFTTQNVVVYFHVQGKKIRVEVLNPDTLEPVDEMILQE